MDIHGAGHVLLLVLQRQRTTQDWPFGRPRAWVFSQVAMSPVSLRSPGIALTVFVVAVLAALAFASVRHAERFRWIAGRMPDLAYQAGEECVRQISAVKDRLLFSGFGVDPGAESKQRHDGNYESSGWVEVINTYGHRVRAK